MHPSVRDMGLGTCQWCNMWHRPCAQEGPGVSLARPADQGVCVLPPRPFLHRSLWALPCSLPEPSGTLPPHCPAPEEARDQWEMRGYLVGQYHLWCLGLRLLVSQEQQICWGNCRW